MIDDIIYFNFSRRRAEFNRYSVTRHAAEYYAANNALKKLLCAAIR